MIGEAPFYVSKEEQNLKESGGSISEEVCDLVADIDDLPHLRLFRR